MHYTEGILLKLSGLVCSNHRNESRFVEVDGYNDRDDRYGRSQDFSCKRWAFKRGDPWTIVNLYMPMWDDASDEPSGTLGMHNTWFIWTSFNTSEPVDVIVVPTRFDQCGDDDMNEGTRTSRTVVFSTTGLVGAKIKNFTLIYISESLMPWLLLLITIAVTRTIPGSRLPRYVMM